VTVNVASFKLNAGTASQSTTTQLDVQDQSGNQDTWKDYIEYNSKFDGMSWKKNIINIIFLTVLFYVVSLFSHLHKHIDVHINIVLDVVVKWCMHCIPWYYSWSSMNSIKVYALTTVQFIIILDRCLYNYCTEYY